MLPQYVYWCSKLFSVGIKRYGMNLFLAEFSDVVLKIFEVLVLALTLDGLEQRFLNFLSRVPLDTNLCNMRLT